MSGEKKVEAELVPEGLTPEDMQIPERPAPVEGHVAKFASEFTAAMLAKGNESAEAEAPAEPEAPGEGAEEVPAKPAPAKTPEDTRAEEEAAEAERWDKERQRKDQEAANERKELTKSVADLSAKLDQALQSKPAETKPAKPAAEAVDVDALLAEAEGLDPDVAGGAEFSAVIKKMAKGLKLLATKPVDAESQQELKTLRDGLKAVTDRLAQQDQADAQAKTKADSDHSLEALDKQYGAQFRKEASDRAQEMLAAEGYTTTVPITVWKAFHRAAYAEVAFKAAPGRKPVQRPMRLPSVAGGRVVPSGTKIKPGSLDDVMAQLNKREAQ